MSELYIPTNNDRYPSTPEFGSRFDALEQPHGEDRTPAAVQPTAIEALTPAPERQSTEELVKQIGHFGLGLNILRTQALSQTNTI